MSDLEQLLEASLLRIAWRRKDINQIKERSQMPDFRTMFDKDYLYAFMLNGREVTVEIAKVQGGQIKGDGGKSSKKPICHFKGKDKPLALNVTNCKTIAAMYGNNTDQWIGKRITIYPTTTDFGGKTVDCIRVRQGIPRSNGKSVPEPEAPPDEPPDNLPDEPGMNG